MLEDTTPARAFQISNKHLGLETNLGRMDMFLNWLPAEMFKKQSPWSLALFIIFGLFCASHGPN